MGRRRPSAASSTALPASNPGRLIREGDLSAVRHDRLLLAERECGAAGGAIVGGLRRSRPDARNNRRVHACD